MTVSKGSGSIKVARYKYIRKRIFGSIIPFSLISLLFHLSTCLLITWIPCRRIASPPFCHSLLRRTSVDSALSPPPSAPPHSPISYGSPSCPPITKTYCPGQTLLLSFPPKETSFTVCHVPSSSILAPRYYYIICNPFLLPNWMV